MLKQCQDSYSVQFTQFPALLAYHEETRKAKENEQKIAAHSVRVAELMKAHEHGILTTTTDKLLVDFVTKVTRRVDSGYLRKEHPSIYAASLKPSESRKVKVTIQPA